MALATQQHYLAEISEKLEGIQRGVDELKGLHQDDRVGTLKDAATVAARTQSAAVRDGRLQPRQLDTLRQKTGRAEEVWQQVLTTAERHVRLYREGKIEPREIEESVILLMFGLWVLAECSDALTSVPYATVEELQVALSEEEDRMFPTMPATLKLCAELLELHDDREAKQLAYEARRRKNRVVRTLRLPAVRLKRNEESIVLDVPRKPKRQPLPHEIAEQLRRLVTTDEAPPTVVAEIDSGGQVLLGPAETLLPRSGTT
jgi:hypothetical protein